MKLRTFKKIGVKIFEEMLFFEEISSSYLLFTGPLEKNMLGFDNEPVLTIFIFLDGAVFDIKLPSPSCIGIFNFFGHLYFFSCFYSAPVSGHKLYFRICFFFQTFCEVIEAPFQSYPYTLRRNRQREKFLKLQELRKTFKSKPYYFCTVTSEEHAAINGCSIVKSIRFDSCVVVSF